MNLTPLSKTTHRTFCVCPWKAHAHKNLGFPHHSGPAADIAVEVRLLLAQVLEGTLTHGEAHQKATSTEIAGLVARTLAADPASHTVPQMVRQYVAIDKRGCLVSSDPKTVPENACAHGYLDRIVPDWNGELLVVEWKTRHVEQDDPFSRHLHAGLLARALFPKALKVRFVREYVRTGKRPSWLYTFNQDGTEVCIQGPRGRPKRMHDDQGPLQAYLQAVVRRIEATAPEPFPGEHCTNWHGAPCQFLGRECPAESPVLALIDADVASESHQASSEVLQSMATDPDYVITPEQASWAWTGVSQLEQMVSRVKKRLKAWARDNGPIRVGEDRFGWTNRTENVVDAVYALGFMLKAGVPLEAICTSITMSRTSIGRLPGEYDHIREALMAIAVTTRQGKPTFGRMQPSPVTQQNLRHGE